MAKAKKCDRCWKYYDINTEQTENGVLIIGMSFTDWACFKADEKDLCDECIHKLKRFLDGVELEEKA